MSGVSPETLGTEAMDSETAIINPAAGAAKKPGKKLSIIKHLSPRAIIQVFLTVLALGSAVVAFVFSIIFQDYLTVQLEANYEGTLKSEILPCIRSTLQDQCNNQINDQCWDRCCPPGYICERSPVVGLYCQDGGTVCGGGEDKKANWCRDFADIPGTCKSEVCQTKAMVHDMTLPAFFLAGLGVVADVVDCVVFFAVPDSVQCKAGVNLFSSCVKWVAFGVILGAGTQQFMTDLYDNQCFNKEGMTMVQETGQFLVSFVVSEVISALISLILAPISAYYGGKLIGVPYVK
eukprot:CAMPEP_0178987232 /NCGR_PEP_ID=MMETSP0795-20121207/3151_1 /TAXON_ID=88552 /ORGANISM="Amoebophrya sp., Strain Ameob2" /LENGTH=290 /DNA_ID=CAMNT_0020678393 /DNA_START=673 /DNA_END=1545 /DNA_ORIENTATION=-